MECEDKFGITILDADATAVHTPGDLTDLVIKQMRMGGELPAGRRCLLAGHFRSLRDELVDRGVKRESIRPSVKMGELLPTPQSVRGSWVALHSYLGQVTAQSDGERKIDWQLRIASCSAVGISAAVASIAISHAMWLSISIGLLTALVIRLILWDFDRVQKANKGGSVLLVPEQTLGDLIRSTMKAVGSYSDDPDEIAIWYRVRMLIAEQMGMPIDRVVPDANFIRDLGLE